MAYWCGLDPGTSTGLAIWDSGRRRLVQVETLPLWRALDEVRRWHYACLMAPVPVEFRVVFEDARQRKWLPRERNVSEYRGKLMGAGSVKRDAVIWEEFLKGNKIPYSALPPRAGATKWPEAYWQKVTGWTGRTSNHARDAALLVLNR